MGPSFWEHILMAEYYSAMKRNKQRGSPHRAPNRKGILLSERSQAQNTQTVLPFV